MKLISMTDFVIKQKNECIPTKLSATINPIFHYADFLKRDLSFSMFIPCNEKGEFLLLPKEHINNRKEYYKELDIYQKALENVLFSDFRIEDKKTSNFEMMSYCILSYKTIEDLLRVRFDFNLTESAVKQIGL